MSNIFSYKGTLLSEILAQPLDAVTTTDIAAIYYVDSAINTAYSSAEVERFNDTYTNLEYTVNGNPITNYVTPTSWYWTQPANNKSNPITAPSWANYMTVICIGGGGGGGGGGNGFDPSPTQTKGAQNGCTGGGGSGAEYKIYRGLKLTANSNIQITIGAGGQGGGSGVDGKGGGTTSVVFQRDGVNELTIESLGGNGGQGGGTGGSAAGGAANVYKPYYSSQWRGNSNSAFSPGNDDRAAYAGEKGNSDRTTANGGSIFAGTEYSYVTSITDRGNGGSGGIGGNYNNQGRQDGFDGTGGYIRIYWMP